MPYLPPSPSSPRSSNRLALTGALTSLLAGGCLTETAIDCPQGQLCPAGTVCRDDGSCAPEAAVVACEGKLDAEACSTAAGDGVCADGVCVAAGCGNGVREPTERCDDGNQVGADGCSADCISDETCGNEVVDPLLGEQCDRGAGLSGDGCSSACQAEIPAWRVWSPPLFEPYTTAALAYDVDRRQAILIASDTTMAYDGDGWSVAAARLSSDYNYPPLLAYDPGARAMIAVTVHNAMPQTWVLEDGAWVDVAIAATPALATGNMAYFPPLGGLVAVGLDDEGLFATYLLADGVWTRLAPASSPPPRTHPGLAYDPAAGELVLACGSVADAWRFDGDTWTAIAAPTCGNGSSRRAMTYDPVRGGVLLLGGGVANLQVFDGSSWATEPSPRFGAGAAASMVYLPERDGVLAAGYQLVFGFGGAWQYPEVAEWPHEQPALAYDRQAGEVVRFGGAFGDGDSMFNDLSRFDGQAWSYLEGWGDEGNRPVSRSEATMVYDDQRRRLVLFGGRDWNYEIVGDTWMRDATGWVSRPGAGATPREGAGAAYDRGRGEVVMFGGGVPSLADSYVPAEDGRTFVLRDDDWVDVTASPSPSARFEPLLAYDGRRGVVVLWGGYTDPTPNGGLVDDTVLLTDTWEYDGAGWREVDVEGPPGRIQAAMAYDEAAGVVAVYGGRTRGLNGVVVPSAEHWVFDGARWRRIDYAQAAPPAMYLHRMTYDARRRRLVAHGSLGSDVVLELWSVNGIGVAEASSCSGSDDDDGDGLAGCDDPDCAGACTPGCPPLLPACTPDGACGDGVCNPALEDRALCAVDCDACGDGVCARAFEDDQTCPADCGRCGDGACVAPETGATCPGDCGPA